MLTAQDAAPRFVADQGGHRDPGLTLRVYTHSLKETRSGEMERLAQRMNASQSSDL
jgi:hypothetical protein